MKIKEIIRRIYWFIFGADRALYLHAQCLDAFLEIERGLKSGRFHFRESEQNYDFLNLIGKAATSLDRFSTFLYNRLSSSEKFKDIANYIKNNNRILRYIKQSFFKETTNKPKSFEITSEALRLIDGKLIPKHLYKLSIDELKSLIAYFYYHAFLTFSFIYLNTTKNKISRNETFLKFKYDKKQFKRVASYINQQLKKITSKKKFHLFADKLPFYIIKISIGLQDKNIAQLFDRSTKVNFYIEPLTWRLGVNIWLIGQTLQDRNEIVDSNDYNDTAVETIKENIFKYLNETYTFYESSTMDFRKLYEAESNLLL